MPKRKNCLIVALLVVAHGFIPARADGALHLLPENALGFVVVQNVEEASGKFEQLLNPFEMTFPAPLNFAKLVTGLDAGLDVSGNLVIAHIPGGAPKAPSVPLVLLPINDYGEFATSINADSSGEICRITLLGEDILAAQNGAYAMLMNVEDREMMQELLAIQAGAGFAIGPIQGWLHEQDLALVVMPAGVEYLSTRQYQPKSRYGVGYEFGVQRSVLSQVLTTALGPGTRNWARRNVELAAIGITVDEQFNLRLGEQIVLKENSPLAKSAPSIHPRPSAKLGLAKEPCVFSAVGPVEPGWGKQLAAFLRQTEQAQSTHTGLEKVTPELWDKEEQAFRLLLEDIRSCSVVMLAGEKGEPLLGNFLGIATVEDVPKYLKSLPQVVQTWNELNQQSTAEIPPLIELVEKRIAGNPSYQIVVDIASAMRDPNVPTINWMLEATLGGEGKLRVKFVQVDQTKFLFGLATEEQLTELMEVARQDKSATPQLAGMQETRQLLGTFAPWQMLISPQGCLKWTSRVVNEYLVLLDHAEMANPEMPDSPPVGLTMNWSDRHLEFDLVCPAATWETLGKYLETFIDQ